MDYVHFKACFFAHFASGSHEAIFPPGFIQRPGILAGGGVGTGDLDDLGERGGSGKIKPEVDEWSKRTFAEALWFVCLKEIEEWDVSGPLLLESIPACEEEDGRTLWVGEPGIAFVEGDLESLWEMCGLKKGKVYAAS